MEYIYGKLFLMLILPTLLAGTKVAVDKFLPALYAKLPKQIWMAVVPVLVELSTTLSPDLLLFPGLPAWASTAIYSVGALGAREFMTQLVKLSQGDTAPAGTIVGPPTAYKTPPGM